MAEAANDPEYQIPAPDATPIAPAPADAGDEISSPSIPSSPAAEVAAETAAAAESDSLRTALEEAAARGDKRAEAMLATLEPAAATSDGIDEEEEVPEPKPAVAAEPEIFTPLPEDQARQFDFSRKVQAIERGGEQVAQQAVSEWGALNSSAQQIKDAILHELARHEGATEAHFNDVRSARVEDGGIERLMKDYGALSPALATLKANFDAQGRSYVSAYQRSQAVEYGKKIFAEARTISQALPDLKPYEEELCELIHGGQIQPGHGVGHIRQALRSMLTLTGKMPKAKSGASGTPASRAIARAETALPKVRLGNSGATSSRPAQQSKAKRWAAGTDASEIEAMEDALSRV